MKPFNPDGWFKSGDLAKFDKHKNIVILGRCKENIVLSTGKKAAPDDIEQVYRGIESVDELVVCGVPAKEGSYDEVHAFVVCAEDKREQTEEKLKEISSSRRSGNETKRHTFCGFYIQEQLSASQSVIC